MGVDVLQHRGQNRSSTDFLSRQAGEERSRWHGAVGDWPEPHDFLWGLDNPVATRHVLDGLRELRPAEEIAAGAGHYPQVEVPDAFAQGALRLLDPSRASPATW